MPVNKLELNTYFSTTFARSSIILLLTLTQISMGLPQLGYELEEKMNGAAALKLGL
jgi:hypothetical protein